MIDLEYMLARYSTEVDKLLRQLIPGEDSEPTRLHSAMRWSTFAGGKRIRPALVFMTGEIWGVVPSNLARAAASVELIHTFSLIHDDLPAMDDDDLRRGRLTCHRKFDEATAILAGDALQVLAFKTIADDDQLSHEVRTTLISELATATGTPLGMVAGQQLDLDAEGQVIEIASLENIHSKKTGALIRASVRAGALIGNASAEELAALTRYAERLGLLFQITDDLLDVTQATKALGKTAGKDASNAKATYPGHFGVERAVEMAHRVCDEAVDALRPVRGDTNHLAELARLVLMRSR
jgi:geranylgeranyl pyrophosphate synthase